MPNLFDAVEADRLKEEGMHLAGMNRERILELAKTFARHHCGFGGVRTITTDDVYAELERWGYDYSLLGPAAGSIFKGKSWEFTGEWRKSTRVTNHGRMVRVWRLKA